MAIKTFKDIEQKKGYRVEKKDREIFEREVRRGIFGIDVGDIIEFVLYDSSDNPLPQESANGKTVRYIYYTDENIKKYFSKVNNTKYNIKRNGAEEFFIDVEKLIKEAGYSQGVFKTSVSLLNRRLGSEERKYDKAWIHEISPSRTEVRVLPVIDESTGSPNEDLQTRYDTFTSGEDFAADVILFLDEFTAQFDVTKILRKMLGLRGKAAEGQGYINLIQKEFKIDNFERWLSLVKISFDKSLDHYKNKRYFNILEQDKFGQPTGEGQGVNFNSKGIIQQLCDIAENCVNYHLPTQDIRRETVRTRSQQETLDKVERILKTVRSDGEYLAEAPTDKKPAIRGCRDPKAKNYNASATVDDICEYEVQVTKYKKVPIPPPPPPPPPPPSPPSPPRPKPPKGGGTPKPKPKPKSYSISASPIESQPSPKNGRIIQQFRMSSNPAITRGKSGYKYKITSAPSWCKITVQERSFALPILRVRVYKNEGAARSGTVSFSSTLPGSPTTSVTITQEGTAASPPPKPNYKPRGTIVKDICLGTTRKYALADGKGGLQSPIFEKNSPKCGYIAPSPPSPPKPRGGGGGGGCLVAGTQIEMADGSFKSVEDIKIGDSVLGLDILTLSPFVKVEDNWEGENIEQYQTTSFNVTDFNIISESDVYSINGGILECSDDHKHMVKRNNKWSIKLTSQLMTGDILMTRNYEYIEIQSIDWVKEDTVYLITLDGRHTYYANGILTHNYKEVFREREGMDTSSFYDE